MNLLTRSFGITVLGIGLVISVACSKKKSSSTTDPVATETTTTDTTTTTTDTTTTTVNPTTTNALGGAFPSTLALTVFPTESSTGLHVVTTDYDPNKESMKAKIADQSAIIAGTADSCLPEVLDPNKSVANSDTETCYEFDQDMIYGTNDSVGGNWLGTLDGTASTGEACLVSYTRNQVSKVVAMVDQTLGFGMAAICQHKKLNADAALPAIGDTVDLAPAMEDLFGSHVTVKSASLERLADSAAGFPVYRILLKVTRGTDEFQRTIGIIHSPHNDDNTIYNGTIYTIMEGAPSFTKAAALVLPPPNNNPPANNPAPAGNNPAPIGADPSTVTKWQHIGITYEQTITEGVKNITAEMRVAQINEDIADDAITADGLLDLNVGTNIDTATLGADGYGDYTGYSQANDAVDGITFVAFSQNPETSEGTMAYWKNPGGNYKENARGFNIEISKDTDGVLGGCATSGAASTDFTSGISIRRYLNEAEAANDLTLNPKGYWHPFMHDPTGTGTDDNGDYKTRSQNQQSVKWYVPKVEATDDAETFVTDNSGSLITRQCFKQDADTGLYMIDTAKTTEAAGFELIDTGNAVNAEKLIALPPPVRPELGEVSEAAAPAPVVP